MKRGLSIYTLRYDQVVLNVRRYIQVSTYTYVHIGTFNSENSYIDDLHDEYFKFVLL